MFGPEVIPAPRVMAVEKFLRHFNYVLNDTPPEGALVQLWAVAHGTDEQGEEMLLVAHSIIGEGDEPIDHMPMKKSAFEKLLPLSLLGTVPEDLSALSEVQGAMCEGPISGDSTTTTVRPVGASADEGFDLADRWMSGRKPVRQTVAFLRRSILIIPGDVAEGYVQALQRLELKDFHEDGHIDIAAICFAIATLLNACEPD